MSDDVVPPNPVRDQLAAELFAPMVQAHQQLGGNIQTQHEGYNAFVMTKKHWTPEHGQATGEGPWVGQVGMGGPMLNDGLVELVTCLYSLCPGHAIFAAQMRRLHATVWVVNTLDLELSVQYRRNLVGQSNLLVPNAAEIGGVKLDLDSVTWMDHSQPDLMKELRIALEP